MTASILSILKKYFPLVAQICYEIDKTAAYLTLTALVHVEDTAYQHYLTLELPATTVKK